MKREIVDCSVFARIFLLDKSDDPVMDWYHKWKKEKFEVLAPQIIVAEFASAIWQNIMFSNLSRDEGRICLKDFQSLRIQIINHFDLIEAALNIAVEFNISIYDALYVALSYKLNCNFVTLDKKLVKKLEMAPIICSLLARK